MCETLRNSCTSATVRVCVDCLVLTPRPLNVPGCTKMVLAPRPAIRLVKYAPALWVSVRAAMTAATPIKMPSMVKIERVRLAQIASNAVVKLAEAELNGLFLRTRNCRNRSCRAFCRISRSARTSDCVATCTAAADDDGGGATGGGNASGDGEAFTRRPALDRLIRFTRLPPYSSMRNASTGSSRDAWMAG